MPPSKPSFPFSLSGTHTHRGKRLKLEEISGSLMTEVFPDNHISLPPLPPGVDAALVVSPTRFSDGFPSPTTGGGFALPLTTPTVVSFRLSVCPPQCHVTASLIMSSHSWSGTEEDVDVRQLMRTIFHGLKKKCSRENFRRMSAWCQTSVARQRQELRE